MGKASKFSRLCAAFVVLAFGVSVLAGFPQWYSNKFGLLKNEIEDNIQLPGETMLNGLFVRYLDFTGTRFLNGVIILNDDRLLLNIIPNPPLLTERAKAVAELNDYLKSRDIDFIFMGVPNGMRDNAELPKGIENTVIQDSERFISLLGENGVKTLDYRQMMRDKYADFAEAYYWGDHHWRAETALWAYGQLGTLLNEEYGFAMDEKTWDPLEYEYIRFTDTFIGHMSRRLGKRKEDVTALKPKFPTDFVITDALTDKTLAFGDFTDVFIPESKNKDNDSFTYGNLNDEFLKFTRYTNLMTENDKKVLLIGDSFMLPFATYLASSLACLDVFYLESVGDAHRLQQWDLYPMLETREYDLVLLLCYEGVIQAEGQDMENSRLHFGERPSAFRIGLP
jgi:hypothetical protein